MIKLKSDKSYENVLLRYLQKAIPMCFLFKIVKNDWNALGI
jgi:hypothetical protein